LCITTLSTWFKGIDSLFDFYRFAQLLLFPNFIVEGFHCDLYKVKQENNPLSFTFLLPTILDNKVIPLQSETREQSPLFHSLASNNPGQQGIHNKQNFVQEF
jgi:hypothetical protein